MATVFMLNDRQSPVARYRSFLDTLYYYYYYYQSIYIAPHEERSTLQKKKNEK